MRYQSMYYNLFMFLLMLAMFLAAFIYAPRDPEPLVKNLPEIHFAEVDTDSLPPGGSQKDRDRLITATSTAATYFSGLPAECRQHYMLKQFLKDYFGQHSDIPFSGTRKEYSDGLRDLARKCQMSKSEMSAAANQFFKGTAEIITLLGKPGVEWVISQLTK